MNYLAQIGISVLSVLISLAIILWIESLRKPRLGFTIGETSELPPNDPMGRSQAKWTHVCVYNKPMPRWMSWAFNRSPALSCRGWITFHDLDGQDLFARRMVVRWANNPEPLVIDPETGKSKGVDWDKMRIGHIVDIPPGGVKDGEYGNLISDN